MAVGMMYSGVTSAVAVTAAQDVVELLAPSDCVIVVHSIVIAQYTDVGDAAEELLSVLFKRASGSYTSGSGGSTPSKNPLQFGFAAAGATLEMNNTSQASAGSGALTTIGADAWNVRSPYIYTPTPETQIVISPAQAFVLSITAPADSLTTNATIIWEEIGG